MSKQSDQPDPATIYQQSKTASSDSPTSLDNQLRAAAKVQASINAGNYSENKKTKSPWVPAMAFACICLVGITFVLRTNNSVLTENEDLMTEIKSESFSYDAYSDSDQLVGAQAEIETKSSRASELSTLSNRISSDDSATNYRRVRQSVLTEAQPEPALPSYPSSVASASVALEEVVVTGGKREESIQDIPTSISFLAASSFTESELDSVSSSDVEAKTEATTARVDVASITNNQEIILTKSGPVIEVPELVEIAEHIPSLVLDIHYFGINNFVGEPIDGYLSEKALLTQGATNALAEVQKQANEMELGLKIFDAYRPQRAVNHFLYWVTQPDDAQAKTTYYPNIEKSELFEQGYLAERSAHSRGSTVDLTLIKLSDGTELDMGTGFDFFDSTSWGLSKEVSEIAQENRRLLRSLMTDHGFEPFETEWWHFTLKDEPYLEQYFDIPID